MRQILIVLTLVALAGCQTTPPPLVDGDARMYPGFGNYERTVSTSSADAQRWFDQGIQLLYGYNHDEAIRSFQAATRQDPNCAMAWWGISYAAGLHINNPDMTDEKTKLAVDSAQEAMRCLEYASPVEQALIRAVVERYEYPNPADRSPLDQAYADAMEEAWRAHPTDPDVGALYAEALMNLQPWDLWTHDGEPKGRTLEIVATLERVMELRIDHPGANHFYIHAVEASKTPERAVPAADRLCNLVPGSGHLVHMPSHIYTRVGRYADAAKANERAIAVDEAYFAVAPPPDFYTIYFIHNVHFLAYASMMEGRYESALAAARKLETDIPEPFLRGYTFVADGFMPTSLHVMIRFGKWDDILAEPAPPDYRFVSRATRHYARGVAYSAKGDTDAARQEREQFEAVVAQVPEDWMIGGNNKASYVFQIARHMLDGELAFREGRHDEAFESLRAGAALEDGLAYDEPPGWMQPVRHALGALMMAAGRPADAEPVYRADLERNPNNGWALLGLELSLAAQGKRAEAAEVSRNRAEAWARADVAPMSSCYCEPGHVAAATP